MSEEKNIDRSNQPQGTSDKPKSEDRMKNPELKNDRPGTKQTTVNQQPETAEKNNDDGPEIKITEEKNEKGIGQSSDESDIPEIIIQIPQPSTEKMETHANELHKAPGHGWKHYLFEFLMLFLAITLGFFVENIREHLVEKRQEKTYILSIRQDLQSDISQLDTLINIRKNKDAQMDSLLYFLNGDPRQHGNEIYYYARWLPRTFRFYSTDRTISQLKNAGTWRLIRNKKVSDQLIHYDDLIRDIGAYTMQREESLVLILYNSIDKLFDNRVFEAMVNGLNFDRPVNNPQLLSYDKTDINELCTRIHFRKNSNLYFIATAEAIRNEAKKSLDLIQSEYDFK